MHLSYKSIANRNEYPPGWYFIPNIDIDKNIFYSVPSSFFTIDSRIPEIIRELITEGEECLKMNLLTGASACIRKSIYELLVKEKAEGKDYEERIKSLKHKYLDIDFVHLINEDGEVHLSRFDNTRNN